MPHNTQTWTRCAESGSGVRGRSAEIDASEMQGWDCLKSAKPASEFVPGENTRQVRLMLQQNRIDAAMTGGRPLAYQNTLEGNKFAIIGEPVEKALTGIGFS